VPVSDKYDTTSKNPGISLSVHPQRIANQATYARSLPKQVSLHLTFGTGVVARVCDRKLSALVKTKKKSSVLGSHMAEGGEVGPGQDVDHFVSSRKERLDWDLSMNGHP
jgi:hypothetical protein